MRDLRTPSTYFQHYSTVHNTVDRSIRDLKHLIEHLQASQQSEGLTRAHRCLLEMELKREQKNHEKKKRKNKVKVIVNAMLDGDPEDVLSLMGDELSRRINERLDPQLKEEGRKIELQIFG